MIILCYLPTLLFFVLFSVSTLNCAKNGSAKRLGKAGTKRTPSSRKFSGGKRKWAEGDPPSSIHSDDVIVSQATRTKQRVEMSQKLQQAKAKGDKGKKEWSVYSIPPSEQSSSFHLEAGQAEAEKQKNSKDKNDKKEAKKKEQQKAKPANLETLITPKTTVKPLKEYHQKNNANQFVKPSAKYPSAQQDGFVQKTVSLLPSKAKLEKSLRASQVASQRRQSAESHTDFTNTNNTDATAMTRNSPRLEERFVDKGLDEKEECMGSPPESPPSSNKSSLTRLEEQFQQAIREERMRRVNSQRKKKEKKKRSKR